MIGPKTTNPPTVCNATADCGWSPVSHVVTRHLVGGKPVLFASPMCADHTSAYLLRLVAREPEVVAIRSINEQYGPPSVTDTYALSLTADADLRRLEDEAFDEMQASHTAEATTRWRALSDERSRRLQEARAS